MSSCSDRVPIGTPAIAVPPQQCPTSMSSLMDIYKNSYFVRLTTCKHFTDYTTTITMSSPSWNRLIRFVDDNGKETFGEPCVESEQELTERLSKNELHAIEYKGDKPTSATVKGDKIHVKALLNLFKPSDVPIIRCIGLNYQAHSMYAIFICSGLY